MRMEKSSLLFLIKYTNFPLTAPSESLPLYENLFLTLTHKRNSPSSSYPVVLFEGGSVTSIMELATGLTLHS